MGMPERYYEEVKEGSMIPEGQPISARTPIGVGPGRSGEFCDPSQNLCSLLHTYFREVRLMGRS